LRFEKAEDFVIVEESGIAKGIRRISGYTRIGALIAREKASSLLNRLEEALLITSGGPELIALYKAIKVEVSKPIIIFD
jgi:alanyl-tRNA synthetase